MKLHLFVISIAITLKLSGQNLVPNGSFEEFKDCPEGNDSYKQIKDWTNCLLQFDTPDLFNVCSSTLHVPNQAIFDYGTINRTPHSGRGFIGMYAYLDGNLNNREFIQCKLRNSLINKKKYHIEFYISLGPQSKVAIDGMALGFLRGMIKVQNATIVFKNCAKFIRDKEGEILSDTVWTKIEGNYQADGTEKSIIIGNLLPDNQNRKIYLKKNKWKSQAFAYYFIDDVSIIPIENEKSTSQPVSPEHSLRDSLNFTKE